VLAALGVELIELQDHGVMAYCCGGGGGVVSIQRAAPLRQKVFEIKREQVDATGAKRFITSCGQCLITLEVGAKNAQWDKRAESLLALVADNLAD
jgi:Fe-S oxidoreductase